MTHTCARLLVNDQLRFYYYNLILLTLPAILAYFSNFHDSHKCQRRIDWPPFLRQGFIQLISGLSLWVGSSSVGRYFWPISLQSISFKLRSCCCCSVIFCNITLHVRLYNILKGIWKRNQGCVRIYIWCHSTQCHISINVWDSPSF